jgi:replicative DNA helicase
MQVEQSVIGACLIDQDAVDHAIEILSPSDFLHGQHSKIFQTIVSMANSGMPIDPVSVSSEASKNGVNVGVAYLSEIMDATPSSRHVKHYARVVKDSSVRHRALCLADEIRTSVHSGEKTADILGRIEKSAFDLRRDDSGPELAGLSLKGIFKEMEWAASNPGKIPGMSTGFTKLDNMTGGLINSDLVVIGARPSVGKSALMMNFAEHISVIKETPALIFSLEMSRSALVRRLLLSHAMVDGGRARVGRLKDYEYARLTKSTEAIHKSPIYIDDTPGLSVLDMRSRARRMVRKAGIRAIMVDYLQLATSKAESRFQEVSEISRQLKAMAKELDVPVVALSQLSRKTEENGKMRRPSTSDLRESGQIEQDADIIIFLHRETKRDEDGEIIVDKQRNGPTGIIPVKYHGPFTRFQEVDSQDQRKAV